MTALALDGHHGAQVQVDLCVHCHVLWFDKFESLQLSPASTLKLMKTIGESSAVTAAALPAVVKCPRCSTRLRLTHDLQRNTRFTYLRCAAGHGRLIRFFEFLKEKDFIRPLSGEQIAELRQHIQMLSCSHCGASIDLTAATACPHCGSALSMLDMKQPRQLLEQLRDASKPREVDPSLPLDLLRVKREVEASFGDPGIDVTWWRDVPSSGLVQACLASVARWLTRLEAPGGKSGT